MTELKDYFCDYEQTQELIKLGLKDYKSLMVWNKENGVLKLGNSGVFTIARAPLRSQALDFFRDLGWDFQIGRHLTKGYWFACAIKGCGYALPNFIKEYHEAESALIDKLIELEMEARNGN